MKILSLIVLMFLILHITAHNCCVYVNPSLPEKYIKCITCDEDICPVSVICEAGDIHAQYLLIDEYNIDKCEQCGINNQSIKIV